MTRQERYNMVAKLALTMKLTVMPATTNSWLIAGPEGHRGVLVYNQHSGIYSATVGNQDKRHYGSLEDLLALLAGS